jgi:site-specific recombinase XerD
MLTGRLSAIEVDKSSDELHEAIVSWERSMRGRKSPATIRAYTIAARALRTHLLAQGMPTDPARMTGEHVGAFLDDQAARNSPSTARLRHAYLSVFFRWLVDEGEIKSHPLARIKAHRVEDRMPGDLDDADFDKILATTSGKGFEQRRDRAILLLLNDTGLRRAECASVGLEDIDLDTDPPRVVVIGKGNRQRVTYFRPETASILDRYIRSERARHRLASSPRLWLGRSGPLSGEGIGEVVKRRARQAGVSGVHAHLLRHRWAHGAKSRGMSDEDMMVILGHADRQMLDRYGRVNRTRRAGEAYKRLMMPDAL